MNTSDNKKAPAEKIRKTPKYSLPDIKIEEVPGKTSPQITTQETQGGSSPGGGGSVKIGTHTIPKATTTGLYDITDVNIDFIPSLIRIQAVTSFGTVSSQSDITTDSSTSSGVRYEGIDATDDRGVWYGTTTRPISLSSTISAASYSLVTSFDSFIEGGIRINITANSLLADAICTITAYE